MKTMKKISLIEAPQEEEVRLDELEEALGGWSCGTYSPKGEGEICREYRSGVCANDPKSNDYCGVY